MAIELKLDPSSRGNLPRGGAAFLDALSASLTEEHVRSILLFGSAVKGQTTDYSDIDLIIILKDDVSEAQGEAIQNTCSKLAGDHLGVRSYEADIVGQAIDNQTGMFQSGFVTWERDVEEGNFPAIFNTNRLAYLLAPWRTVLVSVFETAESIYGPKIQPGWENIAHPLTRTVQELFRNWLMTFLLSIAQPIYITVSKRAMLYSLEAYKWTTYTCAYHITESPALPLDGAVDAVPSPSFFDIWFLRLRETPQTSLSFLVVTPLVVSLVHISTIFLIIKKKYIDTISR